MAIGNHDPVRALALMHVHGETEAVTAILLVQIRPHAIAPPAQAKQFGETLMMQLRAAGWIDPTPVLSGDQVDLPADALVEGATGDGPITVTAIGEVIYEGPVSRPPGWPGLVRATGAVMVLVGTDQSLDRAVMRADLVALAAAGKVLAAYGRSPNPLLRNR